MSNVYQFPSRYRDLGELLSQVLQRHPHPEDAYEIAATLESMGYGDTQVRQSYGCPDVFALATRLWDEFAAERPTDEELPSDSQSAMVRLINALLGFLRGMIFALPMAVSVASMLVFDFSLWSYQYFSVEYATAIAVGTILSFMVVGGFTQAIGRRGLMYIGQGHYYTARRVVLTFVRLGYLACLAVGLSALAVNIVFSIFPWRMMLLSILYYSLLSAIWLSVTIMYVLKRELTFTGLIIVGIAIVFVLFRWYHFDIIVAQALALIIVAVMGLIIARTYFDRAERQMEKGIMPPLPRLSVIVYSSLPFFAYGFLYFTFLFVDRVLAWSTNTVYMPYLVWFRGEYELGLDLALVGLVVPMGFVEGVISEMVNRLLDGQKRYRIVDARLLARESLSHYYKSLVTMAVLSLVNAGLLTALFDYAASRGIWKMAAFRNATTHFVYTWAIVAYILVALALMNTLLLFCLSCQRQVVRLVSSALLVNLLVGFALSRWFSYSWAVFGLLTGSLVFFVVTLRAVTNVLGRIDYHLYKTSA